MFILNESLYTIHPLLSAISFFFLDRPPRHKEQLDDALTAAFIHFYCITKCAYFRFYSQSVCMYVDLCAYVYMDVNLQSIWPGATGPTGFYCAWQQTVRYIKHTQTGQSAPPLARARVMSSKTRNPRCWWDRKWSLWPPPPAPGTWLTTDDISFLM